MVLNHVLTLTLWFHSHPALRAAGKGPRCGRYTRLRTIANRRSSDDLAHHTKENAPAGVGRRGGALDPVGLDGARRREVRWSDDGSRGGARSESVRPRPGRP